MRTMALAFAASGLLAGCGEVADERENPNNAASESMAAGDITDPQLVGILQATIAASSAMASEGQQRASNANVLDFVDFQSRNARNARVNVARIAAELGIDAEISPFVTDIENSSLAQMIDLRGVADTGFDDAFLISVADAQSFAAASFADSFTGNGSRQIAALMSGMRDALEMEAGFSQALQGDFDATDFLMENQGIGGSSTPGAGSGSDGGLGGEGTATGNGQDPGSGVGTGTPNDDGSPTTP